MPAAISTTNRNAEKMPHRFCACLLIVRPPRDRAAVEAVGGVKRAGENAQRVGDCPDPRGRVKVLGRRARRVIGAEDQRVSKRAWQPTLHCEDVKDREKEDHQRGDALKHVQPVPRVAVAADVRLARVNDVEAVKRVVDQRQIERCDLDDQQEWQRVNLVDLLLKHRRRAVVSRALGKRRVDAQVDEDVEAERNARQRVQPAEQEMIAREPAGAVAGGVDVCGDRRAHGGVLVSGMLIRRDAR